MAIDDARQNRGNNIRKCYIYSTQSFAHEQGTIMTLLRVLTMVLFSFHAAYANVFFDTEGKNSHGRKM